MPRAVPLQHPLIVAAGITITTFLVYVAGACRTIYVGDSGDLATAAATLGIPHPTGYPLYVLLGHLWTLLLPLGSVAFRLSLLSAACAALACGLLSIVLRRVGLSATSAAFAGLLLAFSPSFWSQANVQRVYSLNALAVVAVTAAACEWYRTRRIGWMVLAAWLAGLGAANHTYMAVFGLAVGIAAVAHDRDLLRQPRALLACVGAGLAGLAPYLYLPWRSRADPALDWGNPETLTGFLDVVLRRKFWHRAYMESPADWLTILADYGSGLGRELLWLGTALAVFGAVFGWRRGWPVLMPLLAMAGNVVSMGLHGSRTDLFYWSRYYIPSYVMATLLAAYGLEFAVRRYGRRWTAAAFLLPVALLVLGYPRFDRSRFRIADDFSRTLIESLPPGAHLAASDDNVLFVLMYLHWVEQVRPDVHLIAQGVGNADLGALRFDPDEDPVYFTHHPNWNVPGLEIVPIGLTFRTVRTGSPVPEVVVPKTELEGASDPRVPKDYLTQNLIGHFHAMLGMTFEHRDWPRAATELRKAMAAAPDNDVLLYNLGLIYQRNGMARRALAAFERSAAINPRHIPSGRPVRAADRVEEVRAEVARRDVLERRLAAGAGLDLDRLAPQDHRRLAALLAAEGEDLAARGHRLLALEGALESGSPLALLGLPPVRDMPGRILAEGLIDPIGTERVATYEGAGVAATPMRAGAPTDDTVRREQLARLRSLGYLGGVGADATASSESDRNLAAIHFQAGRYREAAGIYKRLIDVDPDSSALHASLAGVLGALQRYEQALAALDRAIALEPLNVEALHNRAVIFERRGDEEAAIADYRAALRYRPHYEPSRRALLRLTGSADPRAPTDQAERAAAGLVEQASQAARRTEYPEAMRLLDQAEQAAPRYVLVYQYRSNVAYLAGDVEAAREALEKALALEPDNALFRANLERLMDRETSTP